MKKVVLTGIRKIELISAPEPTIFMDEEVMIEIKTVGVCGSDIHYYSEGRIGSQVVEYPFAIGHECSGIVREIGPSVKNVKVGDLVVVDPAVHCGNCDQCLTGRLHTCRNNLFLGCPGQLEGCLSEYIVMPCFSCFPVTHKMNPVQAALIEPFAVGVYSVKQAGRLNRNTSVLVFGAGPIGLSILMKLAADGIDNTGMIEPLEFRLKKAGDLGARYLINPGAGDLQQSLQAYEKLGVDVVFEASGDQTAVSNALKALKPGGRLVLVGIPPSAKYTFDMDLMRRKELNVINIRRQNHCVQEAIEMVINGKADVEKMVTHRFSPEESAIAFDMVAGYKKGVIKAIIDM